MNIQTIRGFHASSIRQLGRGAGFVRARPGEFLTDEQIMAAAPSVFAAEPHESRSAKYQFHSTGDLLTRMRGNGFLPVAAQQSGAVDPTQRAFTKHLLRFRHADMTPARKVGDAVQEIVLVGSHNGTSSTIINSGWFRLICLNGMVAFDSSRPASEVRIQHFVRDGWDKVIEGSYTVIEDGDRQAEQIEQMKAIALNPTQQLAFAEQALTIRYGDKVPAVEPAQLLRPRRAEDVGNSVWLTLNRAQEHLMRGGLYYRQERTLRGRSIISRAHTRPVNGIDGNMDLNKGLWNLALETAGVKALAA